jgi:hypothetical protein
MDGIKISVLFCTLIMISTGINAGLHVGKVLI